MIGRLAGVFVCLMVLLAALPAQEPPKDPTKAPPKALALLVGIDRYQLRDGQATMRELHGCANDVQRARDVLVRRFGFRPEDIHELVNEQATHERIVKEFYRHLIQKAGPDTKVVFWFSGHGSRIPDATKTDRSPREEGEAPWNETLVAHDSRAVDPAGSYDLVDDELHALLKALPAKDVVVVTDCCHSGGVLRGGDDESRLGVRYGDAGSKPFDPEKVAGFWPEELGPPVQPDRGLDDLAHVVHIAACDATTRAGETEKCDKHYGTMSWHLTCALAEIDSKASWQQVVDAVRGRVACDAQGEIRWQRVQCIGDGRRGVFGGMGRPVPPGFAVTVTGREVEIAAGVVHGVGDDTEFDLVSYDGKALATLRVARVYMTRCKARLGDRKPLKPIAMRALLKNPGKRSAALAVALGDGVPASLVEGCPWAKVVADDADYRIVKAGDAFELRTSAGEYVRAVPNDRQRAREGLLLEYYWRSLWYGVAQPGRYPISISVAEAEPPSDVRVDIDPATVRWSGGRGGAREPVAVVVSAFASEEEERAEVEAAQKEGRAPRMTGGVLKLIVKNDSRFDLHVAVVSVNEAREVHVVTGKAGNNTVIGAGGKPFEKLIRVGCEAAWLRRHPDRPMVERLVVIATRRYADFGAFESSAPQRLTHRGEQDAMPAFLRDIAGGGRMRNDEAENPQWGIRYIDLPLVTPEQFKRLSGQ